MNWIFIKCKNTTKSDKDNYIEDTHSFKDFLKEYLTEEKLINSERKKWKKYLLIFLQKKMLLIFLNFKKKIMALVN